MTAASPCNGTAINGSLADGLVHGTMCRRAIEDLPECMARHFKIGAVQLDGGDFHCHSDFLSSPCAVLSLERIARRVHLSCELRDDWIALTIPVEPAGSRFNGERISDAHVPLALPGARCEWSICTGSVLLFALVDRRRLVSLAESGDVSSHIFHSLGANARSALLRTTPHTVDEVRGELLCLIDQAADSRVPDASSLDNAVVKGVLRVLDSTTRDDAGTSSAASLVRRAKKLVGEAPKKINAAELSTKLQVSPRTLSYAFKAVTGASPHAYFLRERLNAARAALLHGDPRRDLVTNIALELGFTELGRFSSRYRELFGELPSTTLARCLSNAENAEWQ